MEDQNIDDIQKISINVIDQYDLFIDYTDGELALIDNLKDIPKSEPLMLGMNIIAVCLDGKLQLSINGETFTIQKNDIMICPPNTILSNYMGSPDFDGKILCLTNKIMQTLLHSNAEIWNKIVYVNKKRIIRLEDDSIGMFNHYYQLIISKTRQDATAYQKVIMQSLLQSVLLELCVILTKYIDTGSEEDLTRQGDLLFKKFIGMLSSEKIVKRTVNYYAENLFVSPKYLTVVCKNLSGKTASDWIHEYVEESIRYHLKYSSKSIKEIADELEFPNISFFGKYVRSRFGVSPRKFRKQIISSDKMSLK